MKTKIIFKTNPAVYFRLAELVCEIRDILVSEQLKLEPYKQDGTFYKASHWQANKFTHARGRLEALAGKLHDIQLGEGANMALFLSTKEELLDFKKNNAVL